MIRLGSVQFGLAHLQTLFPTIERYCFFSRRFQVSFGNEIENSFFSSIKKTDECLKKDVKGRGRGYEAKRQTNS